MSATQSGSTLQKKPARRDHLARGSSTLGALCITHHVQQSRIRIEHVFDTNLTADTNQQLKPNLWIKPALGISPTLISRLAHRQRLQDMNTRHCVIDSALGELTVVADDNALTGVYFRHHWHRPHQSTFGPRVDAHSDVVLAEACAQLTDYLAGDRAEFDVPANPHGDQWQRRIWTMLTAIPYGGTVTYGELADALADGTTAQQVGQAVGRNPLCIVIPCHRVVGSNGQLTGYAGGLKRKHFLLDLEEPAEVKSARLF
jgi:methylated-DNA-[protein]-cysteine S-methyltransferase